MFIFRLESLLNMHRKKQEAYEAQWQQLNAVYQQLGEQLMEERNAYFHERDLLNQDIQNSTLDFVRLYESSLAQRQHKMVVCIEKIRLQKDILFQKKNQINAEQKRCLILEKLKAKQQKKYEMSEQKKEQQVLDDTSRTTLWQNVQEPQEPFL